MSYQEAPISKHLSTRAFSSLAEIVNQNPLPKLWLPSEGHTSYPSFLLRFLWEISSKSVIYILEEETMVFNAYRELARLIGADHVEMLLSVQKKKGNDIELEEKKLLRRQLIDQIQKSSASKVVITTPSAILEYIHMPSEEDVMALAPGQNLNPEDLELFLDRKDFKKVDFVSQPGEYSIRGGILDVFSYLEKRPYRIEFFGDEIESLRLFEIGTQVSTEKISKASIANYTMETNQKKLIFDDVKDGWFCADFQRLDAFLGEHFPRESEVFASKQTFDREIRNRASVDLSTKAYFRYHWHLKEPLLPSSPPIKRKVDRIFSEVESYQVRGYKVFIACATLDKKQRILRILKKYPGLEIETIQFDLYYGFVDNVSKVVVYSEHEIFGRVKQAQPPRALDDKKAVFAKEFSAIQQGDYVTHIDYGVGRFAGLVRKNVANVIQDCIRVVFAEQSILDFSVASFYKIGKYKDKDVDPPPTLAKMGGKAWNRLKDKAKKKLKVLAIDLTRLYSERKSQKGISFQPDTEMMAQLEGSFLYDETPDQTSCMQAVREDMLSEAPMDRLICGDVGFGKTEIAVRAAFTAASSGYQVIVLVPTTILCLQHYKTFSDRFADFPVRVAYLNRFVSPKEVSRTWEEISQGKVDVVIATHKIFGKKAGFKKLGLLIIDEEQKFGVGAKEKIRSLKKNIDTLVLTATPIPRTLKFSIMGLRDLSVLNTPPPNRIPIQTEIIDFDFEKIVPIIEREMARGGQSFIINNRIVNLEVLAGAVEKVIPGVRVVYAHGRMGADELEKKIISFINGDHDVLVATNIIENGIDIPNANTILINDAHRFGLSDLHQMRGRVGRSNKQAYCYLMAPDLDVIPSHCAKRLKALVYYSDMGSGIRIAMQDLETRGAGDLFGAEQSGFVNEMGHDTYFKIMEETLQEIKDETDGTHRMIALNTTKDCLIDTDVPTSFPPDYVENVTEKLSLYTRASTLKTEDKLDVFLAELEDRFGRLPLEVSNFGHSIRLKIICGKLGLERLIFKKGYFIGHFPRNPSHPFFETPRYHRMDREASRSESPFQVEHKVAKDGNPLLLFKAKEIFQNMSEAVETVKAFQKSMAG